MLCVSVRPPALTGQLVAFLAKLPEAMPAAELIFVRMSMTGICTYAAMRVMGIEHPFLGPPGVRLLLAMRGVVGFGGIGSLYYSLAYLPLGDATSITFLGPCAAAILSRIFLGETFTLAQLREVHEAVLRRPLDAANFRRQVEGSGSIVPTGERLTGGRHRPPKLYCALVPEGASGPLRTAGPLA